MLENSRDNIFVIHKQKDNAMKKKMIFSMILCMSMGYVALSNAMNDEKDKQLTTYSPKQSWVDWTAETIAEPTLNALTIGLSKAKKGAEATSYAAATIYNATPDAANALYETTSDMAAKPYNAAADYVNPTKHSQTRSLLGELVRKVQWNIGSETIVRTYAGVPSEEVLLIENDSKLAELIQNASLEITGIYHGYNAAARYGTLKDHSELSPQKQRRNEACIIMAKQTNQKLQELNTLLNAEENTMSKDAYQDLIKQTIIATRTAKILKHVHYDNLVGTVQPDEKEQPISGNQFLKNLVEQSQIVEEKIKAKQD